VRSDPAVNRLWQVAEVCSRCSSHIPHATMVSVSARPGRVPDAAAEARPEPAGRPAVAGGFSSGGLPPADPGSGRPPRRSSRPAHPPRRRGSR
jgi:hypothetical protein